MFRVSPGMQKVWGPKFVSLAGCRACQCETVKVKFVYNRLTGKNGGGQINSRTTSKKLRAALVLIRLLFSIIRYVNANQCYENRDHCMYYGLSKNKSVVKLTWNIYRIKLCFLLFYVTLSGDVLSQLPLYSVVRSLLSALTSASDDKILSWFPVSNNFCKDHY